MQRKMRTRCGMRRLWIRGKAGGRISEGGVPFSARPRSGTGPWQLAGLNMYLPQGVGLGRILKALPGKLSSVTFNRCKSSSVTLSKTANCALNKELILVAIFSESETICFPQSSHSLDTFNTSHRLIIVPKEAPATSRSMVEMNCVERSIFSASSSCVHPIFSRASLIRLPIAIFKDFLSISLHLLTNNNVLSLL